MYLKKIEIQGFKSFADKIALTPDKGVTAIVGPNGSGKSNITDAIRWVLGEQSVKSLRGAKMDDVIFSGTEFRKPSGFAEVTLILDNGDGGLRVPYSEVSVTRRIYRSGESEYLINKSLCRLKDVNELFFDTGIGREGYSIVGQGKVDEILNDKPEERRGIFEEAAGITKYKVRRHEAERKLEATSQNLLRIRDITGELETQMGVLEGQAAVARQYLRLRDELKEIEVAGYVSSIGKYEKALEKCDAAIDAAKEESEKQAGALAAIEASAARIHERAALLDRTQAELTNAVLEIEARLSSANNKIELNNEKSGHAAADIERIAGEIARAGERNIERGAELKSSAARLGYLTGELARYEKLLEGANAEYAAALSALGESDRAIEEMKRAAEAAKDKYYEDMNRMSAVRNEREHYVRAVSAIDRNLGAAVRDIDATALAIEELGEQKNALSAKTAETKKTLAGLIGERGGIGAALEAKRREAGEAAAAMNAKRSRLKILSDMEYGFEGFAASVRRVLSECRRAPGFGEGICGAVASLIRVPKELETAVGFALGASQQHIVTDGEDAAKRAIEFLKRNGAGRATFLPINAVRGRKLDAGLREKLAQFPGYVGVASELIQYDKKYENVINDLLGTTVTVETLDDGLRLASKYRHMFRILTVAGEIISAGGAITGGSAETRDSGLLSRQREIPELAAEIKALEKSTAALAGECGALEEALGALTQKIAAGERAHNELLVENAALVQRISGLEDKLGVDASKRDLYKSELEETKTAAAELDRTLAEMEKAAAAQSEHIEKLQEEIRASSEKNRGEQQLRDELLSDISAYNVSVASITEAKKAASDNVARLESELADSDRSIASRESAIARYRRDIEKFAEESEALRSDIVRIEQERQGARLRIESSSAERASLNDETRALSDEAARVNGLLGGITREIGRHETRRARVAAELDHCRNRLWEDYELTYHNALAMLPGGKRDELSGSEADIVESIESEADTGEAVESASDSTALNPPLMGEAAAKRSAKIREEMRALGQVNVLAIDEYAQTKARYDKMTEQSRDLEEAGDKLRLLISEMSAIMSANFEEQFNKINANFDVVFKELFSGGRARLILSEGKDILEAGIEIEIQLPGKRMQNMMLYSGGERALTAIALIFAMLTLKPAPFCLLDEIESTLDEANVERFSNYIKKYSDQIQFIMVTHRKGTMEGSNALYGVTMQERGVSGVVSLRLSDAS